jgi:hypothetical protein
VEDARQANRTMEKWSEEERKEGRGLSDPGEWLIEDEEIAVDRRRIVFHRSQYIALSWYECVE